MKKILFSMFYSILVGEEPDPVLLKKMGIMVTPPFINFIEIVIEIHVLPRQNL